jgi:hypothetical protein
VFLRQIQLLSTREGRGGIRIFVPTNITEMKPETTATTKAVVSTAPPRVPGKRPPPTMGWGIRINLDTRKSMRATRSREMPRNEGSGPSGVRRNTPGGGSLRIPSIQPPPIPNPSQIWESGSPHFRSLPSQSGDFSALVEGGHPTFRPKPTTRPGSPQNRPTQNDRKC